MPIMRNTLRNLDIYMPGLSVDHVLRCAPGLGREAYRRWIKDGVVTLERPDKAGDNFNRCALDVLQASFVHLLSGQGIQPIRAAVVWSPVARPFILRIAEGNEPGAFLYVDGSRPCVVDGGGLQNTEAALVLRLGHFTRRVCAQLRTLQ